MRTTRLILGLALLAAGCGGSEPAPVANDTASNDSASNAIEDAQNRLAALPEGLRNGTFIRAIRDSGQTCQHVESSEPIGEYRGFPVWRALCEDGTSWTIVVFDDGGVQVINDSEARLPGFNMTAPDGNAAAPAAGNAQ